MFSCNIDFAHTREVIWNPFTMYTVISKHCTTYFTECMSERCSCHSFGPPASCQDLDCLDAFSGKAEITQAFRLDPSALETHEKVCIHKWTVIQFRCDCLETAFIIIMYNFPLGPSWKPCISYKILQLVGDLSMRLLLRQSSVFNMHHKECMTHVIIDLEFLLHIIAAKIRVWPTQRK